MQCRMCATANCSLAMVTYIAAKHRGETGLVYEGRDDAAPDLDIGDAAYAITRTIANMPRCNFASRKFGAAQGSKLFFQTNRKGRWACGPCLNLVNQIRCDAHVREHSSD